MPVLQPVSTSSHSGFGERVHNSCPLRLVSFPNRGKASAHLHLAFNSREQLQKGQLEKANSRAACGRHGIYWK